MKISSKLFILGLLFFSFSCGDDFNKFDNCESIKGSGTITSRTLDLGENISKIELNIPCEFVISAGTSQEITIEGHPNILDLIESKGAVTTNKWEVLNGNYCIDSDETKIYAQLTSLERFQVDGVADIKSEGTLDIIAESLRLDIDGAAKLELNFTMNKDIDIDIDGAGEIILSGVTEKTKIDLDGASNIKLHEMITQRCDIDIDGASNVEVNVIDDLIVEIDGAGKVCYLGNPIVSSDIDGIGTVTNCN